MYITASNTSDPIFVTIEFEEVRNFFVFFDKKINAYYLKTSGQILMRFT